MMDNTKKPLYKGMIGLDLDGTALDEEKHLRPAVREAMEEAIAAGYLVIPATGRPVRGLSAEMMSVPGVNYAVTSNGAVLFKINDFEKQDWEEIYRDPLPDETVWQVVETLKPYDVIIDCFIDGHGNMPLSMKESVSRRGLPQGLVTYILKDRAFHEDWEAFVRSKPGETVKMTIIFDMTKNGAAEKEEAREALKKVPGILVVSGGRHNLEISRETTGKGKGMLQLCRILGVDPRRTMGCGDEGNDLDLIESAAFGVVMGNAGDDIKACGDFVTLSNEEDGAALGIREFLKRMEG
ncbi:MAG: HAD family phosphatase [Lachnospiraceae bacterium]|nr:HAD family phosphatase [Lachnospiraceae bacterium]MBQ4303786.1 HAD family phosphatase [Lachnospiraceae bacterium]